MSRRVNIKEGAPSKAVADILYQNIIGTPGKSLVYQHLKTKEKISKLGNSSFLSLEIGGRPVGACCFINREVSLASKKIKAYYIRYFSFKHLFRSSESLQPKTREKGGAIRAEIKDVLKGKGLSNQNPLLYAYVDESNHRSKSLIDDFGFQRIGTFRTVFFSRFSPKKSNSVYQLEPAEFAEFRDKIRTKYQKHSLVITDNIGFNNGCFEYRENGNVIAGVQAHPEHWRIYEVPGSRFLIKLVSRIPWINRIINIDFHFLSIEGLFGDPNRPDVINNLLESVLVHFERNTLIACMDVRSEGYQLLTQLNRGFIKHLTSEKEIAVVGYGDKEILDKVRSHPIYVSGFDNM